MSTGRAVVALGGTSPGRIGSGGKYGSVGSVGFGYSGNTSEHQGNVETGVVDGVGVCHN